MPSYPDRLSNQDDGRSAGKPFAIDQEDLFERRVDAQPLADLGVLPREDDFVDAAQGGLQVGHDLLAAHDQDHSASARLYEFPFPPSHGKALRDARRAM